MESTKENRILIQALLIIGAYMIIRGVIYLFMPPNSQWAWFYRDCWMSVPRVVTFFSLLLIDRYVWKSSPFDFHIKDIGRGSFYGGILVFIYLFHLIGSYGDPWPKKFILIGIFTSAMVGLFEEYAFRGVILGNLAKKWSKSSAVLGSSAIFTLFHFQAQPLTEWPGIFLAGVVFANLRLKELSLFWLVVIHTVIDAAYFFFGTSMPEFFSTHKLIFLAAMILYGIITYPRHMQKKSVKN